MLLAAGTWLASGEGTDDGPNFVTLDVQAWHWAALVGIIIALLLIDLVVFHKEAHDISTKEAAVESVAWISIGLAFSLFIWWQFGGAATAEYFSGYLVEKSLSVDNVFVWALIFSSFAVPVKYQHRVLFWGIFGALVLRAVFIFVGSAAIERYSWVLYIFGAFLLFTAIKLMFGDDSHKDPADSKFLRLVRRVVPSTDQMDGQKLFTKANGKRLATPLFAVLVLVEATDVVFAVDSVPAVFSVSREQFIIFASNAFAILGLRALYFLLADMHARFSYLNEGLAIILAFVGIKMIIEQKPLEVHIDKWLSLMFIALVLLASVAFSLKRTQIEDETISIPEDPPIPSEM